MKGNRKVVRKNMRGRCAGSPLTPALSPLRGEGEPSRVRSAVSPSPLKGERAGVRGEKPNRRANVTLHSLSQPQSSPLQFVILGLSITSSWGNGHATTYRGLVRELAERGHKVLFLERDVEWYATNRDLPKPPYARTVLYRSLKELKHRFASAITNADVVMVGSYVPQGTANG